MVVKQYVPAWATDVLSHLSADAPLSAIELAERVGAAPGSVAQVLAEEPRAVLAAAGWVDGLRLAEGVAFVHELAEAEVEVEVLAADIELALFAALASAGLPLAGSDAGGTVRARPLPELPLRLRDAALPAGRGLIGQALLGPPGWLAGFEAGDLLAVRLVGGAIEVTAASEPVSSESATAAAVAALCMRAAGEAVLRFQDGEGEQPAAALPGVLADLLATRPELFAGPLPPLERWLRVAGCEAFGGHVGLRGVAWNRGRARELSRAEEGAATFALATLLASASAPVAGTAPAQVGAGAGGGVPAEPMAPAQLLAAVSASPAVVSYLADEVELRTAVEGEAFATALEELRGAAAEVPAWRAVVALLSARVAEGAGDCQTAEREVRRALADWPELRPALMDAGEYAACRGELREADEYLRRADHPIAATLRSPVRELLAGKLPPAAAPADRSGRNQPCPCGSGRKRKVCCLAIAAGYPLAARAALLYGLLGTFAQRAPGMDRLGHLIVRSGRNIQATMLCLDALLAGEGFTERFLHTRGEWLRSDERALIEQWARTPIAAYEVRQVQPGTGATVRTLPDGEQVFLRDRSFSTSVGRLDLLCGRLLSDGSQPRVLGLPALVDRSRRRELVELLAAVPSAGQLAEFFGPQPDSYLRNSDGHDYFDTEVTLEVADVAPAWRRLIADPELVEVDAGKKLDLQVLTGGRLTSRGTVSREGRRLVLWANSRERLAELEERVRAVVLDARETGRRAERLGGEPPSDDRPVRTLVLDSQIVPGGPGVTEEAAYVDAVREQSRSWLDTPNDLGMTPRQAAVVGGPAGAELAALVDDIEWRNGRLAEQGRPAVMDVALIRRELQLPADGWPARSSIHHGH